MAALRLLETALEADLFECFLCQESFDERTRPAYLLCLEVAILLPGKDVIDGGSGIPGAHLMPPV